MKPSTREPSGGTRGGATIYPSIKIFSKNPYKLRLVKEKSNKTNERINVGKKSKTTFRKAPAFGKDEAWNWAQALDPSWAWA